MKRTFTQHPAAAYAAAMFAPVVTPEAKPEPVLEKRTREELILDAAATFQSGSDRAEVAGIVHEWAETSPEDLDEGEGMADRLYAMLVGAVADSEDGDLTEDEAALAQTYMELAVSYLVSAGIGEDDAVSAIDGDNDAAQRVSDFVISEELTEDDIDGFAFGADEQEPLFDSAVILDAAYKMRNVVRGGKRMRVNKRVSGSVRLSGAQRVALKKARMRSFSAGAKMKRLKSMHMRSKLGMKSGV
jgi:hypothetical protein